MPHSHQSKRLERRAREIVDSLGGTWRRNRGMCRCPAHDDRTPSLSVTTRRRFTPHGTSCSFLQAVTQLLHSMQRSESQMNFMRAMASPRCYAVARSMLQMVVLVSCIIVTLS